MKRTTLLLLLLVVSCAESSARSASAQRSALVEGFTCRLDLPEGMTELAPPGGAVRALGESGDRENIVVRTLLVQREPVRRSPGTAVAEAKREASSTIGHLPDFELVRDERLTGPAGNRLLVWRYRKAVGEPVVLRFHLLHVFDNEAMTAEIVGESQATYVDALHTPYREVGMHEFYFRRHLADFACREVAP